MVVVLGLTLSVSLLAEHRAWQQGHWRDTADARGPEGAVATAIGGSVFVAPLADTYQTVVIDGPDHMTYIAKRRVVTHGLKRHKAFLLVVNDPVTFAVDGLVLYVRGVDPDDASYEYRFDIVKRTRQP